MKASARASPDASGSLPVEDAHRGCSLAGATESKQGGTIGYTSLHSLARLPAHSKVRRVTIGPNPPYGTARCFD